MTIAEKLRALAERMPGTINHLETEEATKNALVMPFIAALGYDVFNPLEVVPEFTADVGTKKGEKVDYAIKRGDKVILIFEAKKAGVDLGSAHASQLYRYFSVTHARIAVLTNGIIFRFFSDIDAPNVMDEKPFLEIDLQNLRDDAVQQLAALTKDAFDLEGMLATAGDLKYLRQIHQILNAQFDTPDEEFVKLFFSKCCPGKKFVQSAKALFSELVKKALADVVRERVGERLRSALAQEGVPGAAPSIIETTSTNPETAESSKAQPEESQANRGIVTTDEELEGLRIVTAIVCAEVSTSRVASRDTKGYFGVLLDDTNRKPICRLHFNSANKYISLFDAQKNATKHPIKSIEGIYKHADALRATVRAYLDNVTPKETIAPTESA